MTTLTVTRGLPGSGKTTWARQQLGMRVNRDDLRAMLLRVWPHGDAYHENLLTGIQRRTVGMLLECGIDVIVDDTNLRQEHVDDLREIADQYGAEFVIKDFTDVPLETCLARDAVRSNPVGETVIRGMWRKYLAPKEVGQP